MRSWTRLHSRTTSRRSSGPSTGPRSSTTCNVIASLRAGWYNHHPATGGAHGMDVKEFDKNAAIDQDEALRPKMVTVEIAGKKHEVPEGITVIKALWYTGQEVIRGAGCLGGYCGACATYYRTKDDPKVRTCLACSTAVEDGMSFTMVPPFPARKATYQLSELKDPKQDLFNLYPETPLCRNCNACTEACPQGIDVRDGVWRAVFGDFKAVSEMFMDCVMCG